MICSWVQELRGVAAPNLLDRLQATGAGAAATQLSELLLRATAAYYTYVVAYHGDVLSGDAYEPDALRPGLIEIIIGLSWARVKGLTYGLRKRLNRSEGTLEIVKGRYPVQV